MSREENKLETLISFAHEMMISGKGKLRPGQCVFNAAYSLWPSIADTFRGEAIDPFYNDARILPFIFHVNNLLNQGEKDKRSVATGDQSGNQTPASNQQTKQE